MLSHAPPRGVGDGDGDGSGIEDPYHEGFTAYRWLLDGFKPPLWLHGHVHPASVESWRIDHGPSQVVNVTGAVLVEIEPPGAAVSSAVETLPASTADAAHESHRAAAGLPDGAAGPVHPDPGRS